MAKISAQGVQSMTRKEYNGWTNYETWVTKLWLDNDEGSYRYWADQARHADIATLAKQLESEHDEAIPENMTTGLFADLLTSALQEVNWEEIAESLIEENQEDAA